jgi:amino acid adenylation domain-containing protein
MDQDLSQRRQHLSLSKQAQLAQLLQRAQHAPGPEIVRHPSREEALLSPSQERLWFLDQLVPQSTAYHLPLLLRLTGTLNTEALEQALQTIVQRHEALRTSFLVRQGQPMQIIAPVLHLTLARNDLSSFSAAQRNIHFQESFETELTRPFDLAQVPLIRATLFTFHAQEHQLLIVLHHSIADAWSLRVLIQELSAIYQAYSTGHGSPFTEFPLQLGDYVSWLQETSNEQEPHLAYWEEQLRSAPGALQLPFDRARLPVQRHQGAWILCPLPASLTEALKNFARQEHVTPYMLFLSAYTILLSRYSNETDFLIGTPIAQRNRSGLEHIIGFVANTLVLRADLSGNPSFLTLLRRIREMVLAAFSHADVPFEKVVERVQPVRDTSYSPLFQVMFLFQNIVQAPIQAGELLIEVESIEDKGAQFDLTLVVSNSECRFHYSTDLFDAPTITRMAEHLRVLLQGIVAHPEQRIAELPLLTEAERHQMLGAWNTTRHPTPLSQTSIHALFEKQVEHTPTAIAITFENQHMTYQELNEKANQMAHLLIARGIGPEDLVGLAMERSPELLVGLFGILKAGGAYLPLDPRYPKERLSLLLRESRVSLLLTQPRVLPLLPEHEAQVICLDSQWETIRAERKDNPPARSGADNAVYVIFTSGSTGQPKGVVVRHGALSNHALAMVEAIGLAPQECFLQFASISFDASAVQIFPTLISGATLVLHPTPTTLSNYDLWRFCQEQRVTVLDVPTVFWHQWIEDMVTSHLALQPPLRVCMTGGELPALEKVRLWARAMRQPATFISSYGPTEATITATMFTTPNDEAVLEQRSVVPLGQPLAHVQVYVLDRLMQPVPIGVIGEVYIGGTGLARGYLRQPALTAERFIPNPFSAEPGTRLYRTGDLARYLPDGTLEFQGRLDNQIKIRGFRIELGEIETLIRQHWTVQEAIVLARKDVREETRLIAYIVPKTYDQKIMGQLHEQGTIPEASVLLDKMTKAEPEVWQRDLISVLRRSLKEQLPPYMLPSTFVVLDRLPFTPNNKVDYQALPTPEVELPSERVPVPPRTVVEELLVTIWAELLKGKQVGIDDNFFDLGGHSLLATQLISQIRHIFKLEVPLHALFDAPTIAEFVEKLTTFETQPGQILAIAKRRKQIEGMSAEEIRTRLAAAKQAKG